MGQARVKCQPSVSDAPVLFFCLHPQPTLPNCPHSLSSLLSCLSVCLAWLSLKGVGVLEPNCLVVDPSSTTESPCDFGPFLNPSASFPPASPRAVSTTEAIRAKHLISKLSLRDQVTQFLPVRNKQTSVSTASFLSLLTRTYLLYVLSSLQDGPSDMFPVIHTSL